MAIEQTFEAILQRMIARVPPTLDTREGSVVYNAIAPAAAELTQAYIELENVDNRISPDTATGDELTELSFQAGVFRKTATHAIRKGVFNQSVPMGARFSGGNNTFVVVEKITDFEYKLESEQRGTIGNVYTGPIIPINYIDGLTTAILEDVIVEGVEIENDDELRERYRNRIIAPSQDGNVAQYYEWSDNYASVGRAKVFPLGNGGNTVKIAIADRLLQVADSTIVNGFQEYLDPGSTGLGNGVAPIGAKVTVVSGVKKDVNISGTITLTEGYTEPTGVAESITTYLNSLTFLKDKISYMRTAVSILDVPSVADLTDFKINGLSADVNLEEDEIPILNSLNLAVTI